MTNKPNNLTAEHSDKVDKLPPPSALFDSNYFYNKPTMNEPVSPRQVYILPPPSSLPGYHLPPSNAPTNYYYQEYNQHYYPSPVNTRESSTIVNNNKKRCKKTSSNDDISAAAATLASFASSNDDEDIIPLKKKRPYKKFKEDSIKQEVIEAARILMDISRCVVRQVRVAH